MFRKIKTDNFYLYSTEVENLFISDFMIKAPGEYVKAYLLALMYAQLGAGADKRMLGLQLGMSEDALDDCWEYWEGFGVVKRINNEDGRSYDVEFVGLRELIGKSTGITPREESPLDNEALKKLFKDVSRATGRMPDGAEMNEIIAWLNDYNIAPELIVYCYKYCSSKRKSNSYRYVGTILKDWKAKGLRSADDAAEYLNEFDSRFANYKAIFKELGFSRNPTQEEKRLMDEWFDKYIYSLDDIIAACKQTIAISNPNLKYVDAVLKNVKGTSLAQPAKENVAAKINAMYEQIRRSNEELTAKMRSEVFSKVPQIKGIMEELGAESLRQTQALLKRDSAAINISKDKIAKLTGKRAQLLRDAGFGEDALDTVYSCPYCKDTGILEDGSPCRCYGEKLEKLTNGKA